MPNNIDNYSEYKIVISGVCYATVSDFIFRINNTNIVNKATKTQESQGYLVFRECFIVDYPIASYQSIDIFRNSATENDLSIDIYGK